MLRKGLPLSLLATLIVAIFALGHFQLLNITFQGMFAGGIALVLIVGLIALTVDAFLGKLSSKNSGNKEE